MEKYYEDIEQTYQDMEFAIESIIYENELKYSYAMEMGNNPAVASPQSSGTSNPPEGGDTGSKAVDTIDTAGRNMDSSSEQNQEKRDQNRTDREASGNDNPKIRQEVINNVKQISNKLSQFIREHIAELASTMSLMLRDSANVEQELDTIMRNRKPNTNITITDYMYHDNFIRDFDTAVNGAFSDYIKQFSINTPKLGQAIQAIADGDMEKAKAYFSNMKSNSNDQNGQSTDADTTTAAPDNIKFERPSAFVARRLKLDAEKIGEINPTNIKKYAYNHCKGVTDTNPKPRKVVLSANMMILENSIAFIKGYKEELKKLNTNRDNLNKCANNYRNICKDIEAIQSVDEKLKNDLNRLLTGLSNDLNELVTLNKFSLTILKERAVSAEIIIRVAYTGTAKLESSNPNPNNNNNNGTDEEIQN